MTILQKFLIGVIVIGELMMLVTAWRQLNLDDFLLIVGYLNVVFGASGYAWTKIKEL